MSFEINVKPIKGDIIRVKRKLGYYHYGIYIGHNKVIHYSAPEDDSIFDNRNISIRMGDLQKNFLRGDVLEVNIPYSSFYFRFVVCRRAKKLLGTHKFRDVEYDLLKNNCEHFANYCYFGDAVSAQSDYASQGLMGVFSSLGVKIFNNLGKRYRKKQGLESLEEKEEEAKNKKEAKKQKKLFGKKKAEEEQVVTGEEQTATEEAKPNKKDKKKENIPEVAVEVVGIEKEPSKKDKKKKKEPVEQPVEENKEVDIDVTAASEEKKDKKKKGKVESTPVEEPAPVEEKKPNKKKK